MNTIRSEVPHLQVEVVLGILTSTPHLPQASEMRSNPLRRLCRMHVLCFAIFSQGVSQVPPSSALEATLDVTEAFRNGVSLIWSPSGQAAWDALREYHHVVSIEMKPPSTTAARLNVFAWDKAQTLPSGTVIFAGDDSEAFRQRVRDELRKKVGDTAAAMIGPYKPPGLVQAEPPIWLIKSALIVSAISCKPRFPCDFTPDANPKVFTSRSEQQFKTLGFGTEGKMSAQYGDAFRVLEDDLAGSHSVRLAFFTGNEKDRECLVLTSGLAQKHLEGVLSHVRELLQKERVPEKVVEKNGKRWRYTDTPTEGDRFWVPHLHASLCCDYTDLIGKKYLESTDGHWWWEIREAAQLLNVRLDHKGALVEAVFKVTPNFLTVSGASSGAGPSPTPLPIYPKSFVFDKPFVASLWREGADWPYLAFWVDGPEMLTLAK
jgi:hypothetical protein